MTNFSSLTNDGVPVGAAAGVMLAGGNWYFCDPTNGNDSNDGLTAASAKSTLLAAYNLTRNNRNDGVIFLGGATAWNPSTAFTWSNSYTHLIGATNGLFGMGQRARIVNTAANDLAVLFTLSGNGCLMQNIQFSDGKDSAADGACMLVSGARNHLVNCFIAGMGDATASGPATRSGSYGLKVSGAENQLSFCHVGIDTVNRTAANSELIVSGARNTFYKTRFESYSETAGKFLVKIDNAGGDLRWNEFWDCSFYNYTVNWVAGITNAFSMPAGGLTHDVILRGKNYFHKGLTIADNVTRIYAADATPSVTFGIAVNPTT